MMSARHGVGMVAGGQLYRASSLLHSYMGSGERTQLSRLGQQASLPVKPSQEPSEVEHSISI